MSVVKVMDGLSADGPGTAFRWRVSHGDNRAMVIVAGAFGGGTVTLQVQAPDGTWVDVAGDAWAANIARLVHLVEVDGSRADGDYRLNLAGATTPDLDAWIVYGQ